MSMNKQFVRYVSQNILGMMGVSLYILADTFFISLAAGTNGIAALSLVLPLYSVIYAIGAMLGVGSAIRYSISNAQKDEEAKRYFSNAIFWALILSVPFMLVGGIFPSTVMEVLGGDSTIVAVGTPYTRVFMVFTPFFILNSIVTAFVRNDDDPSLAMAATLFSSLFNIVFDYVLMFPLGMGMTGAALATGFSPVVGVAICGIHFFKKSNQLVFVWQLPSVKRLISSCQLGISAFVGEMSSGVTTAVYNWL
ncbi:MAG: polysaccharide biosynthesis C-terminal domain-containing protein, partial [Agathobacter sp.]|nr:polysaccharide biosynthesis C-terminal domain-containing protein [Agathobacter sp.]